MTIRFELYPYPTNTCNLRIGEVQLSTAAMGLLVRAGLEAYLEDLFL